MMNHPKAHLKAPQPNPNPLKTAHVVDKCDPQIHQKQSPPSANGVASQKQTEKQHGVLTTQAKFTSKKKKI